jgi:DHA2 family multidrug resistance protein
MQELLGYSATQSGIALMPRVLAMMVVMPFIGRLYNHVEPRVMVCFGVILMVVGAYWMSRFTLEISTFGIILPLMVQGVGAASLFVPLSTAAISTIPRTQLADATGLYSLSRQIGGSFGLAIFATLLGNYQVEAKAAIASHLAPSRTATIARLLAITRGFIARGADAVSAHASAIRLLDLEVSRQAMVIAFERTFFLGGLTFLLILPIALLLKVERHAAQEKSKSAELHLEA